MIKYLSVDKLYKGQLAKLPAILDSFYTTITNDHIWGGGWGWWGATEVASFSTC